MSTKVFVDNFPAGTTVDEVRAEWQELGAPILGVEPVEGGNPDNLAFVVELDIDPAMRAIDVLREELGLTGTKEGCGRGECGACTVLMEGKPILSCMTLAIECDGKSVETAEGIAEAGHPLIESYVNHHTMQCGYCTPGILVTAKALLDRVADEGGRQLWVPPRPMAAVDDAGGALRLLDRQELEGVMAHELAHQWFGNLTTCGSWQDIWLNEGFASYAAARTGKLSLPP